LGSSGSVKAKWLWMFAQIRCGHTTRKACHFTKSGKVSLSVTPSSNHSSDKKMNSTAYSNEVLDDTSAAAYIGGIKARTIREWRTHRGLPFIKITSRVIRIRRAELDIWLARHRVAIIRTRHRANWQFGSG
jgi:hypothetical protein